jgi:hypothetical protein
MYVCLTLGGVRRGLGLFIFGASSDLTILRRERRLWGIVQWVEKSYVHTIPSLDCPEFFGCNNRLLEMLKSAVVVVLDEFGTRYAVVRSARLVGAFSSFFSVTFSRDRSLFE